MVTDGGKRKLHISTHLIFSKFGQTMIWMKKWIILSIAALATLVSCNESIDKKLVWSDEFEDTGTPDSTKWGYNLGDGCPNCGWGNSELEYYTKDIKNARVEDGMLIIEAHKDSLGGKDYTSGRMVSKQKGDWLY